MCINYFNVICLCSWQHGWCGIPSTAPTAVGEIMMHYGSEGAQNIGSILAPLNCIQASLFQKHTANLKKKSQRKMRAICSKDILLWAKKQRKSALPTISVCFHGSILQTLMKWSLIVSNGHIVYMALCPNVGELMQEIRFRWEIFAVKCVPVVSSKYRASKLL